jgi:hypothetical protein
MFGYMHMLQERAPDSGGDMVVHLASRSASRTASGGVVRRHAAAR